MEEQKFFSKRQIARNSDVESIGLGFQSGQKHGEVVGQVYVPQVGKNRARNPFSQQVQIQNKGRIQNQGVGQNQVQGQKHNQVQGQAQNQGQRQNKGHSWQGQIPGLYQPGYVEYEGRAYGYNSHPNISWGQSQVNANYTAHNPYNQNAQLAQLQGHGVQQYGGQNLRLNQYGTENYTPTRQWGSHPQTDYYHPQRESQPQSFYYHHQNQIVSQPHFHQENPMISQPQTDYYCQQNESESQPQTDYYHQHSEAFGTMEEEDRADNFDLESKNIPKVTGFKSRKETEVKEKDNASGPKTCMPDKVINEIKTENNRSNQPEKKPHLIECVGNINKSKAEPIKEKCSNNKQRNKKIVEQKVIKSDVIDPINGKVVPTTITKGKTLTIKERSNKQKEILETKDFNSKAFESTEIATKAEQIRQQLIQTSLKSSATSKDDKKSSGIHLVDNKVCNDLKKATFPMDGKNKSHRQQKLGNNSNVIRSKKWIKDKILQKIDSEHAQTLIEQLIEGTYECMVCCERVRWSNATWNCKSCFHMFHLFCIRKWASSATSVDKGEAKGWRCPGCQNATQNVPEDYFCFCGKLKDPEGNPRDGVTPHSCGEICKKTRKNPPCSHPCNELCHPGPCPSCPVMVPRACPCGKTTSRVRCGQTKILKCLDTCGKLKNCKKHTCDQLCHEGDCAHCKEIELQKCFCGKESKDVICGTDVAKEAIQDESGKSRYSCGSSCARILDCCNHRCEGVCHTGPCKSCPSLPKNVTHCSCGQSLISDLLAPGEGRKSCLEPIPCCDNFCGRRLTCGSKGHAHICKKACHNDGCGPCKGTTKVWCKCGVTSKEIPCIDLEKDKDFTCEKRCNKKRRCGRHRCNQKCCVDKEHNCNLICGKKLQCGIHKCLEPCHAGYCPRCWQTSFDELACHCGVTIMFPPIPCGTSSPDCSLPCSRKHPCGHESQHSCHSENTCPPCTVLVEKWCMAKHELRRNVPCHVNDVSCGKPCRKPLKCGQHFCLKTCHKGLCQSASDNCVQPCVLQRRECGHPCAEPCHIGKECSGPLCKTQITIACKCGRRSNNVHCLAGNSKVQFQRFASEMLGDNLRHLQSGQSVDIVGFINSEKRQTSLECDEECAVLERNRNLAEALGIEDPDSSHFSCVTFSDFLIEEAKKNLPLIKSIEATLEELVLTAKKVSQQQRSHSFPPMNMTQRKIIHELANHYNCRTVSYDQEPRRNTVLIVTKDSLIPNQKLSSFVERRVLRPAPPKPVILSRNPAITLGSSKNKPSLTKSKTKNGDDIDYFGDDFRD